MKNVAILTAREGSRGFPGKNQISIYGKLLFEWVMLESMKSRLIDEFFVNTDSKLIIETALSNGWKVIPRPPELATDEALSEDVFIQSLNWIENELGMEVEILVLLMANSPTFTHLEIDDSIKILQLDQSLDSAVTVSRYNMWSPLRARRINPVTTTLEPFISLESLGNQNLLSSSRDSQGDVWFADMGFSSIRKENLRKIELGQLPQRWMGSRIYPIAHEGGLDLDYSYQVGQIEWWIRKYFI